MTALTCGWRGGGCPNPRRPKGRYCKAHHNEYMRESYRAKRVTLRRSDLDPLLEALRKSHIVRARPSDHDRRDRQMDHWQSMTKIRQGK